MTATHVSRHDARTHRSRWGLAWATLLAVLVALAATSRADAAPEQVTLVDTLGAASPATTFSVFGSGGPAIFGSQLVGPRFTLSGPAWITEVGAFVNNCKTIFMGVPQCPATRPFVVQIRPSFGGVPGPLSVASFPLSHDSDPLTVSYERAAPDLILGPGSYFALFAPQGEDAGMLLGSADVPFAYTAGMATLGFVTPEGSSAGSGVAAVRIVAEPIHLPPPPRRSRG